MRPVRLMGPVCGIGIALGCLTGAALGQGAPVDRAREAMRREAAAKAAANRAMFDRIKAMPAPLAAAPALWVLPVGPANLLTTEELEPDDEAEENAPRRWVRVYSEQAFDDYLFGRTGGAAFWRAHLRTLLKEKVERAAREQGLTAAQQAKLQLAGKGDIKRLFDQIDQKRKEFETLRRDIPKATAFLRELERFSLSPLHGPWENESLFSKVLDTMLADRAADARHT